MKIIGWTEWDNPKYRERFEWGDTYSSKEYDEHIQCIINELKEKGYKFSGDYHQNGDSGVPIFDDYTVFQCTQRTWGAIMAMAYPKEDDDSLAYVRWAWQEPEESVFPEVYDDEDEVR